MTWNFWTVKSFQLFPLVKCLMPIENIRLTLTLQRIAKCRSIRLELFIIKHQNSHFSYFELHLNHAPSTTSYVKVVKCIFLHQICGTESTIMCMRDGISVSEAGSFSVWTFHSDIMHWVENNEHHSFIIFSLLRKLVAKLHYSLKWKCSVWI